MQETKALAKKIRIHALQMTSRGGSSHIAAILSMADILAVLYGRILEYNTKSLKWNNRDRFILSKGHAGAGLYATLAEVGFFSTDLLKTHYQNGSDLSGHVSHKVPGVEFSTGSLGHGLSVATGMALAAKIDKKHHRVFCLLSDGELDEGSNWEAILFAQHHKLDNLVAVIDYNKIQSLDKVENTIRLEPLTDKWKAFGWNVVEVDGHNHTELLNTFSDLPFGSDKPTCVIAHTTKGRGVSFMENTVLWHYRTAKDEEFNKALAELENNS
ncbi:MAG: transketolase [Proteobacteria bacterium SG_bin7]|nr:MAG: transketolase [Proteobacteria bacterium SG_bin7]